MVELAANGKPVESVWDYPRPPRVERVEWRVRVVHGGQTIVDAPHAHRVLETSQPPAYYVDPEFVRTDFLESSPGTSFCEWKGRAGYVDIVVGDQRAEGAGWFYVGPTPRFASIDGCYAFYAQKVDACFIDDEQVESNDGNFYGGWITSNVTGPFKGAPGTMHW